MAYYNDESYDFIQYLDTQQLEEIIATYGLPYKYSHLHDVSKVKEIAEKELKKRKEEENEKRKDKVIELADTRSKKLLELLEKIVETIVRKPKTAVFIAIIIPVAVAVITNLINFIGFEIWVNILPALKHLGLNLK